MVVNVNRYYVLIKYILIIATQVIHHSTIKEFPKKSLQQHQWKINTYIHTFIRSLGFFKALSLNVVYNGTYC